MKRLNGLLTLIAAALLFAGCNRAEVGTREWSPSDAQGSPDGSGRVAEILVTGERPAGLIAEVVVVAERPRSAVSMKDRSQRFLI
jgi:hypothetical protein